MSDLVNNITEKLQIELLNSMIEQEKINKFIEILSKELKENKSVKLAIVDRHMENSLLTIKHETYCEVNIENFIQLLMNKKLILQEKIDTICHVFNMKKDNK